MPELNRHTRTPQDIEGMIHHLIKPVKDIIEKLGITEANYDWCPCKFRDRLYFVKDVRKMLYALYLPNAVYIPKRTQVDVEFGGGMYDVYPKTVSYLILETGIVATTPLAGRLIAERLEILSEVGEASRFGEEASLHFELDLHKLSTIRDHLKDPRLSAPNRKTIIALGWAIAEVFLWDENVLPDRGRHPPKLPAHPHDIYDFRCMWITNISTVPNEAYLKKINSTGYKIKEKICDAIAAIISVPVRIALIGLCIPIYVFERVFRR